jgi:hypothetical protein
MIRVQQWNKTTVVQSLFFNCRGINVDTGLSAVPGLDKERPLGYSTWLSIYSWTVEQIGIDIFLLLKATQV